MSKFNTSKNKLSKTWESLETNKNNINKKSNQEKFDFFNQLLKQQHIKTPIEIYDSGDINITPTVLLNLKSAIKSELMPTSVSYLQNIDLEIPELFLPFVKYSIEATSVPDTNIHTLYKYDPSTWAGDNIEIKGDDKLIYKRDIGAITGVPSLIGSTNGSYTLPDIYFSENNINLDMTKKVWKAEIFTNIPSVLRGNITEIETTVLTGGFCKGVWASEEFFVDLINKPNHKIINLTSTSFTAVGDFTVRTISGSGASCIVNTVITENIQKTYSFSVVDDYYIRVHSSGLVAHKDEIETQEFEQYNRWLFWSNLKQKLFVLQIKDDRDGDKYKIAFFNLPIEDINDPSSDVLPYTSITLKRNINPSTPLPEIEKFSESWRSISLYGENVKSLISSNRNFENYVKISESDASISKYRFKLDGEIIIASPSIIPNLVTRTNSDIISKEFKSIGTNKWNVMINEGENDYLSGIVQNIYHKKIEVVDTDTITIEFFTDPINNSNHEIQNIDSSFTAIGDETTTIDPIDGDAIITKRNNVLISDESFSDYDDYTVTYSISILDTVDFPVYDDIYTQLESPSFPGIFSYNLTTENHTLLSKEVWLPDIQDIILNIKAHLINPLYWREQRKYIKNDI